MAKLRELSHTELFKHLKNQNRVDKVADFIRMLYRWGFFDYEELDYQMDRLTIKNMENDGYSLPDMGLE